MSFAIVAGAAITGGLGYLSSRSASRAAERQSQAANDAAMAQLALAQEQWDTWKENYQPLELGMIGEAQRFDSPERREAAAAAAVGDVNRQFGLQRDSLGARLQSFGVNPGDAKYAGTFARLGGAQGAAAAGGAGVARRAVEQEGWGRRFAMAGLGRNLMSNAAGGLSSATANLSGLAAQSTNQAQLAAQGAGQFIQPFIQPLANQISQWGTGMWTRNSGGFNGFGSGGYLGSGGVGSSDPMWNGG